jgi:glutathionyl-hydroquinone reductase
VPLGTPHADHAQRFKELEDAISVDVVQGSLPRTGWSFDDSAPGAMGDAVNGFKDLREAYFASDDGTMNSTGSN